MLVGENVLLRKIASEDWPLFEKWGARREGLWGPYQRFQLDHLSTLKGAVQQTALLSREGGMLLIETKEDHTAVGFVRYSMTSFPDGDNPYPEIGFGVPEEDARGKGYGQEGVELLVEYLFSGYPVERIVAFTDADNLPAQHLMENLGFKREGVIRRGYFRDGGWHDIYMYGILREEFRRD